MKTSKNNRQQNIPLWLRLALIVTYFLLLIQLIVLGVLRQANPQKSIALVDETLQAETTPTGTIIPKITQSPALTPTPTLGVGSTKVSEKDGMVMVYVPAGNFLMGSKENDFDAGADEKPQRLVYLDAFWIDKTEVSNAQYSLCVSEDICRPHYNNESYTRENYYGNPVYENFPVINMNWQQASDYCKWTGRRLPTEAEWEKAARGIDGRKYPWGEGISCGLSNFAGCMGDTTEVGSYPQGASPYGALDMAGNVWEWVADFYDNGYYKQAPDINPTGPSLFMYKRVLRGGSWSNDGRNVRTADRYFLYQSYTYSNHGFRCAKDVD